MSNMPPPPPPPDPGAYSPQPDPSFHAAPAMTGWAITGTGQQLELASAGSRLGARILDIVIMVVVIVVLGLLGVAALLTPSSGDTVIDDEATISLAVFFSFVALAAVVGLLYEVVMIAVRGQTLGKMMTSIKVVRADNGLEPGWGKSIGRWIIPVVLAFIPFVGWLLSLLVYLSLLWDSARQGWHDKAAGTLVVKA